MGVCFRIGIAGIALALAVLASPAKAECRAEPVHGWSDEEARWVGPCAANQADGYGVIKQIRAGAVQEIYYGRVEKGKAVLGVVETPDGMIAGRWSRGEVQETSDRNELLSAFAAAEKAADTVREGFARQGNSASAQFYKRKAQILRQQLD